LEPGAVVQAKEARPLIRGARIRHDLISPAPWPP
jgi:hypothetical protein